MATSNKVTLRGDDGSRVTAWSTVRARDGVRVYRALVREGGDTIRMASTRKNFADSLPELSVAEAAATAETRIVNRRLGKSLAMLDRLFAR